MPRLETIQVYKGDFNRKYHNLSGYGEAHNRELRKSHARKLARNWPAVQNSLVELVEAEGKFYIINGQHRIYVASELMNGKASVFNAVIYKDNELESRGVDLVSHIATANAGKAQTVNDLLAMYQDRSPWVSVFQSRGVDARTKQARSSYAFASILRAFSTTEKILRNRRVMGVSSDAREVVLKMWLETKEVDIIAVANILKWWEVGAQAAKARKITTLYSSNALTSAMLIYLLNQDSPALREAPERLAEWPELQNLTRIGPSDIRSYVPQLLYGVNYKRTVHLIEVFGINGRLERI